MGTPKFTRRHLLRGAGAVAVGTVLLRVDEGTPLHPHAVGAAGAAPGGGVTVLAGRVERIAPEGVIQVRGRDGLKTIRPADTATFRRGHAQPATGRATFVPGDEVTAEGQWAADVFVASVLMTMFRPLEGRITGRHGDRLETTTGTLRIAPDSLSLAESALTAKPLAQLAVGDYLVGSAWRDGIEGVLTAARIGVRTVA